MANSLTSIRDACSRPGRYNLLGVVVDTLPIFATRGSSKCVTFTIKDSDLDGPTWAGGVKIKYFNDDESTLPDTRVNDVVFVRNIRVSMYQGNPTGVASQYDRIPWIIFRPEPAPSSSPFVISGPTPFEPSLWERDQAQSLLERISNSVGSKVIEQTASRHEPSPDRSTRIPKVGPPFCLVKDIVVDRFCQMLGQVVLIKSHDSEKCILYLTDYTENEELCDYKKPGDDDQGIEGDPHNYMKRSYDNWPGPWGKRILEATLWDPHAGYARQALKLGDIVLLTYVRPKVSRYLEIAVHEDRKYPDKIHVQVCNNSKEERVQELLKRRAEYWSVHGEPKKETKTASKQPNKQPKKAQEQKKEARKEEGQLTLSTSNRAKKNANVKTRAYTTAITPLEKIILAESHRNNGPGGVVYQLPFQNVHYRSTVRVVDFFPPKLEDFAVQSAYAPLYTSQDSATGPTMGWQWRFCLLVEGIGPKSPNHQHQELVKLYVVGQDGDCLLNEEAGDLRGHGRRLSRVREKLFLLWGNLEEQKKKALAAGNQTWGPVSSVPFECCIKEYGVPCAHMRDSNAMDIDGKSCIRSECFGWERRFAIFGTTIHET
ncbi:unnamed protein product [Penicillium olsonii]|nr:unnamed protein product [Penicillium olsonii]CAG7930619.1 unnamed protein product [Penicillium olsonii]